MLVAVVPNVLKAKDALTNSQQWVLDVYIVCFACYFCLSLSAFVSDGSTILEVLLPVSRG